MKKLTILLIAVAAATCCNAQKVTEKALPVAIKAAFQKQYPAVKKVKWEKEENNFEAEFEINEANTSVVIDASGNIIETEVEIEIHMLPSTIKTYISKNYSGSKIKEAAKITDSKGKVTYEAEVKGKDLIFDTNGNFIKTIN